MLLSLALVILLAASLIAMLWRFRRRRSLRRARLLAAPFPAEWESILQRTTLLYRTLPAELRAELQGHIQVFLAEKRFEGCAGLELTDEIRVTIAASACILLLNRPATYYPHLDSILVYPSAYRAEDGSALAGYPIVGSAVRAGESWHRGLVVISWDDVVRGALDPGDGHNVVMHEFAHQLDRENGATDGVPILGAASRYASWESVLGREFAELQRRAALGETTVLDHYGATNPAEFFAVATETFFERAADLKRDHPGLYDELRQFYNVDPCEWGTGRRSGPV